MMISTKPGMVPQTDSRSDQLRNETRNTDLPKSFMERKERTEPIQLDLFGNGVAAGYLQIKKWKHQDTRRLWKKCRTKKCQNEIPNKPHRHICWECKIDMTPLFLVDLKQK